jgi:heat shock protein HslJ
MQGYVRHLSQLLLTAGISFGVGMGVLCIEPFAGSQDAWAQEGVSSDSAPANEGEAPPQPQKKKGQAAQKENTKQADTKKEDAKKEEKMFPLKTPWLVSQINGKTYGTDRPTFVLDDNYRAKGFSGCNTFSATAYPLKGQGFAVGPIALTKRMCDKTLMDQEKTYLMLLRTSQAWDQVEGALILKSPSGTLRFERSF